MSLNMYLGEVQAQTQSMNAFCTATIQGMEQAIQSIDAFTSDTVLQGQTYNSAKAFFAETFRPLAQGIIYLCEELIHQNDAFPSQFQSQVASTDVIEQEILEQIREIDRMIASTEAINQAMPISGMDAIVNLFADMRRKLQEKLEHLYEFNQTSSDNYNTAIQLAASIATGLAEVQSGKGFSPASGTFSTQGLNMEWTGPIQAITEEKKRKADHLIKDGEMCGRLEETSAIKKAWGDKVNSVVKMFETVKKIWNGTVIGTGKSVEDAIKSMETLSNMNIRNMDIETFINVTYAILHLDETAKNMWHTFSSTVKRDMINGDAESRTQWITYALTQIGIGLIADKGLGRAGLVIKGVKASSGASTLTKGVTLIKEMKHASEILQSFKKDVSYAFSGGTIITKIPQSELNQAYYNFAKTTISSAQKRNSPGTVTSSFNLERSLGTQKKLMYNKGSIGVIPQEIRNKLIGKNFNSFDDFRKEFWKTVADSDYATEFNQRNINLMKEGKAPFAPLSEKYGQHNQYILHHKQPIHQGGDVYNLDNLIIVSPKMHQNVLDRSYHFGKKG
ncbi:T7SS effector LXG polymorphic toxin [Bacillus cereus]|uniref:Cytoplasmic protein n=2 Tax=Bacillus cereus TaxID=1396 RepID=A0A9W5R346_BACCE|nr:T7SS effector LXG polymorphic toxin [Bacillus cereus]EOQ05905.1 cytoplasmic protein [Bacillus cereus VD184]MEC3191394.1 T7SS effector LXG polymorphic toxin [Bacillus cereus]